MVGTLLLLALVLRGRAHLLAEGHVGDLKTSDGRDADPENDDEEQADGKAHEDAYRDRVSKMKIVALLDMMLSYQATRIGTSRTEEDRLACACCYRCCCCS
jgi:hypothetical protein